MIDWGHGVSLARRAVAEHRRVIIVLVGALVLNAIVYGLVVYPLSQRVANAAQREQTAARALADAQQEHAQASGTLTGKSRASAELTTFYNEVLPQSLAGARRVTYLRLAQLARDAGLEYRRATYAPVLNDESTLTRLQIQLVLAGSYSDIRDFVYQLETAPEFVVIDNVQLGQGADDGGLLVVTLDLSTYYRDSAQDALP